MANDFYINPITNDIDLENNSDTRLCESLEELTRQRVYITLSTFLGEWFANINYGTPYFQEIFGKGTRGATDAAIKRLITETEGVKQLVTYQSDVDDATRVISIRFEFLSDNGVIVTQEVTQ